MTTTEQALTAARRLARRAAARRAGLEACPYPADGNPLQRAARRAWTRMYLHLRPPAADAVSFDDDAAAIAAGELPGTDGGDQVDAAAAAAQVTLFAPGGPA